VKFYKIVSSNVRRDPDGKLIGLRYSCVEQKIEATKTQPCSSLEDEEAGDERG